jgi:hypothetical protein
MINNVGILHETLVTRCAQAITANKTKTAANAIRLSKRFFASDKILNAELKLHLSLSRPWNLTEHAAADLIRTAREAAKKIDGKVINEHVTKVSKIIAAALQNEKILVQQETYDRHLLVGKLLSSWRKGTNLDKTAQLESELTKSMCQSPHVASDNTKSADVPSAILNKMMTLRMSEAYSDKLSAEHNKILIAAIQDDRKFLSERASRTSASLRAHSTSTTDLNHETKKMLNELADKLDVSVANLQVIDDKFVAQLLASIDIETEFTKS